jgi:uncharacterized protein YndB with AHSA1/START domain
MTKTEHVYVMYIAATQKRIFDAIVKPEFARQYWGHENVSDWKPGSSWEHREDGTGRVRITGKVVECDPPKRLVMTWASPAEASDPDAYSRVTFELEAIDEMVKLTVTHDQLIPGSSMEKGVNQGWPRVLSSLKTFLETGKPLPTWAKAKEKAAS